MLKSTSRDVSWTTPGQARGDECAHVQATRMKHGKLLKDRRLAREGPGTQIALNIAPLLTQPTTNERHIPTTQSLTAAEAGGIEIQHLGFRILGSRL